MILNNLSISNMIFVLYYIFDLIFIFFLYFSTREISPLCFHKFISIFLLLFNNFSVNFYAILRAIAKRNGGFYYAI